MNGDYRDGMRAAFIAVSRMPGSIDNHLLGAIKIAGTSIEELGNPECLVAAQKRCDEAERIRQEFLANYPPDYDTRRST